jgi:hypothetical protein
MFIFSVYRDAKGLSKGVVTIKFTSKVEAQRIQSKLYRKLYYSKTLAVHIDTNLTIISLLELLVVDSMYKQVVI